MAGSEFLSIKGIIYQRKVYYGKKVKDLNILQDQKRGREESWSQIHDAGMPG